VNENISNETLLEFKRLEKLGWILPACNSKGLFTPDSVDQNEISFPSESYDSSETNIEATGLWATERANRIAEKLLAVGTKTLWEIGAGNGNAAIPLRGLGFLVVPIEPLESGAITLMKNGFPTILSTLEELKLPANSIGAIGAFDVLEHIKDPNELLVEVYRVLRPGGVFVCSVPAYQWLYSDFDISIGHFRRYSSKTLNRSIRKAGLQPINTTYIFAFLVIPAFFLRRIPYLLGRRRKFDAVHKQNNSRFHLLSKLESLFRSILWLEKKMKIKFGLSLITISRK
jgi:SAM-dependent methyltransferase